MSARREGALSAEGLLEGSAPEVARAAERLRGLVRRHVPGAEERVYPGWRALGYRDAMAGYFCGIFPREGHVRLLFERGAALRDPAGLLEGDGRQTRYLVVRPGAQVDEGAIRDLLDQALRFGAVAGVRRPARR